MKHKTRFSEPENVHLAVLCSNITTGMQTLDAAKDLAEKGGMWPPPHTEPGTHWAGALCVTLCHQFELE